MSGSQQSADSSSMGSELELFSTLNEVELELKRLTDEEDGEGSRKRQENQGSAPTFLPNLKRMFYKNITVTSRVALIRVNPMTVNFATATLANMKHPIVYRQQYIPTYYEWANTTNADGDPEYVLTDSDFGTV